MDVAKSLGQRLALTLPVKPTSVTVTKAASGEPATIDFDVGTPANLRYARELSMQASGREVMIDMMRPGVFMLLLNAVPATPRCNARISVSRKLRAHEQRLVELMFTVLQGITVSRRRKNNELIVRGARKLFVNELHENVLLPGGASTAFIDAAGALRIHAPPPSCAPNIINCKRKRSE